MPEAAAQPFVTSQRPTGVASRAATQEPVTRWTWQATPNPTIEAGWTTTGATRPGCDAASEQNKLGNYYCWNRIYEPSTGRWTTPDPAASPWANLNCCGHNLLQRSDPSGLEEAAEEDAFGLSHGESATRYKKLATEGKAPGWYNKSPIAECPPPAKELDNIVLYESANTASSASLGELETYGKGVGVTGTVERRAVGSLDDILSALNEILHAKNCECRCVKTLTIVAHGNKNELLLMPRRVEGDSVNFNRDAFMLGYLLKGALCPGGSINLMSCNSADAGLSKGMAFGAKSTVRGARGNVDWGNEVDNDGNPIPGAIRWKSDGVKSTAPGKDEKGNPKSGDNNEDFTTDDVKGPDGKKLSNGKNVWP